MFWADKIAAHIIESKEYTPYWVDDMFTPSGYAHIGSLRGPLVHDIVFRALKDAGSNVTFTYVFNDFDPVDGLPPELQINHASSLGLPLRTAPSPDGKFTSFADYFASDFKHILYSLGVGATFLSSWDMYHEGKFNDVIRIALDHAETIQDIYQRVSGSKKREKGWLPLQVICEKCGKLGTTRVHGWDGTMVEYTCEPAMVVWAKGCGHTGKLSPFNGNGKLPWKVDWPAHWTVLGVTIEGAGKDHSSAGGSRDIARALCKEVFHIPNPYNLPYEFFLIGGKKMSSSKGLGLKARDLTSLLPAPVGRFLFTRTDYRQAIEFDPVGTMAIPDLFDEYDRCWEAYNDGGDENLARAFVLSQIDEISKKQSVFIPRFRDIANYIQQKTINIEEKIASLKGSSLTKGEKIIIQERVKYAEVWITSYAPDEYKFRMSRSLPTQVSTLSAEQLAYVGTVPELMAGSANPEEFQLKLYQQAKNMGIPTKDAFAAIYTIIRGTTDGPKAAWFLMQYSQVELTKRFNEAANSRTVNLAAPSMNKIERLDLFSIDPAVKTAYPSVSVGVALIRGAHIEKTNSDLEIEKEMFLKSVEDLTTETLGMYKDIISYRKLYKQMGVDWHSRRPSPEALLRRVALKKGHYTVNTCVDAYNLIVMKHHVSVGAFDFDNVQFPTVLRFAGEGDEILLLGDETPTKYTAKELAYYDQVGGYNIDFNFRDAQRTMVTEETKDIWVNVDGIFDISPEQVAQSLHESVEIIIKYCGGTLEFEGVVS